MSSGYKWANKRRKSLSPKNYKKMQLEQMKRGILQQCLGVTKANKRCTNIAKESNSYLCSIHTSQIVRIKELSPAQILELLHSGSTVARQKQLRKDIGKLTKRNPEPTVYDLPIPEKITETPQIEVGRNADKEAALASLPMQARKQMRGLPIVLK